LLLAGMRATHESGRKPMTTETPQSDLNEYADSSTVPQAGRAAVEGEDISLLDLLLVIALRKRIVIWTTVVFALLAIVVSLLLPKSFTATVTLLPPQQNSSLGATLAAQLSNMGGSSGSSGIAALAGSTLGLKNPNDQFVGMFKSRTVEDAMVQRFSLMQEYHSQHLSYARKAFENHVDIITNSKDGLIHITVSDSDPNRAALLANGYIDEFRGLSQHLAITEASQRRLFFEQELEQAKNKLADAEEAMKQTELSTGMIQIDSQSRALIEAAASLRAQITAREIQIQGMQTYATGENSQLAQAQRELDGMREQLAKLGGSEDNGSGGFMVSKGRVPEVGLEYVRKLRDVKYRETIFEILARQYEAAKLDEARQGALIQVVDAAVPPEVRSFPKRGFIVMGATAAGFVFGIFLTLIVAYFQRVKSDPESSAKLHLLRMTLSFKRQ
jgi:tyrosine-protein kinase Etk/Wzc